MLLWGFKDAETESGQMSQTPIELKGSNFTLSVVHLHDAQPDIIHQALQEKIEQAPAFLKKRAGCCQCIDTAR
ncbi:hypothetical protein DZS_00790 [Dickeya ananatis]